MKISREFKIGLVTTLAIALLLWGVNYLKGISIFRKSVNYYGVYNDIGGLIESAAVFMNGYKIGNVSKVEFNPEDIDNIIVEFSIDSKIKLPVSTAAQIKSSSLISGTKDIYLIPGSGPGFYIPGDTMVSLVGQDMMATVDPLIARVDSMLVNINLLLGEDNRENLGITLENLGITMNSLKQSLQPGGDIAATFSNLESVTGNLSNNNEKITATLDNLATFTDTLSNADVDGIIKRLDSTLTEVSALVEGINNGSGTAGALITDESMYKNLNSSLENLDSLLLDLRERPGRYVRFSLFGGRDN